MKTQTKKLIEDLKKEIERQYGYTKMQKLTQLQFAEKLIKAIKKDVEETLSNITFGHENLELKNLVREKLNKILDEALK